MKNLSGYGENRMLMISKIRMVLSRAIAFLILSTGGSHVEDTFAEQTGVERPVAFRFFTFEEHPYVFNAQRTEPGLVIRYVQALMSKTPYKYSLEILPAKRALLEVQRVSNSCVFPVERSQEREVKFRWVSPILISRYGMFSATRDKYNIEVLSDIEGLRIGSYLGSGIGEYLADSGYNVDFASSDDANLTKLLANRIDLWAADTKSAAYIARSSQIDLPDPSFLFFTSLRAMACNKGIPLEVIDELNTLLQGMYQGGEILSIDERFALKNR